MTDFKEMSALDAGLTAAAQAVEHYEMSRYGTLKTWATELGMPARCGRPVGCDAEGRKGDRTSFDLPRQIRRKCGSGSRALTFIPAVPRTFPAGCWGRNARITAIRSMRLIKRGANFDGVAVRETGDP